MQAEIQIQFNVEGFHRYPDAPTQVFFLKERHRHTFRIAMGVRVTDLNREREIFLERERIKKLIRDEFYDPAEFKDMSCEHIAAWLLEKTDYDWASVWEEQTGGARVYR